MKSTMILLVACMSICETAWAVNPYNPFDPTLKDDSRRKEALERKAEDSAIRKKALLLTKENEELKNQLEALTRQLGERDNLILQLKKEIDGLSKKIETLQAAAKNTNEDGVVIDSLVVHSMPGW